MIHNLLTIEATKIPQEGGVELCFHKLLILLENRLYSGISS